MSGEGAECGCRNLANYVKGCDIRVMNYNDDN